MQSQLAHGTLRSESGHETQAGVDVLSLVTRVTGGRQFARLTGPQEEGGQRECGKKRLKVTGSVRIGIRVLREKLEEEEEDDVR